MNVACVVMWVLKSSSSNAPPAPSDISTSIAVACSQKWRKGKLRREEGEKNSGNGGQRSQQKEKPKLIIHAGRRYKRLADF
ncbi:hypothetical protein SUGI_0127890 [Cryptomeria japonica]|nr:hypothetical protein SUGI_0127890 [Cryptomeria japonica]